MNQKGELSQPPHPNLSTFDLGLPMLVWVAGDRRQAGLLGRRQQWQAGNHRERSLTTGPSRSTPVCLMSKNAAFQSRPEKVLEDELKGTLSLQLDKDNPPPPLHAL